MWALQALKERIGGFPLSFYSLPISLPSKQTKTSRQPSRLFIILLGVPQEQASAFYYLPVRSLCCDTRNNNLMNRFSFHPQFFSFVSEKARGGKSCALSAKPLQVSNHKFFSKIFLYLWTNKNKDTLSANLKTLHSNAGRHIQCIKIGERQEIIEILLHVGSKQKEDSSRGISKTSITSHTHCISNWVQWHMVPRPERLMSPVHPNGVTVGGGAADRRPSTVPYTGHKQD